MTPDELAALLAAALPEEGLTAGDVETCCFGPDTEVVAEGEAASVLTLKRLGDTAVAWVLLVAVHPERRRRGLGRAVVAAAADRARAHGAVELHLGNCAPRYVWPGVDFRFTAALALFESCGFEPYGAECNMDIATSFRAEPPVGVLVEREEGDGAVDLAVRAFPHWVDETGRGVERGTCFAARAGDETIGFASHSVNRGGWIGPMATDPARQRRGTGGALLGALCADLEARRHAVGDIAWVGPVGFYAKCGARVSRVFRTEKLAL